jgi:hypothetical protein
MVTLQVNSCVTFTGSNYLQTTNSIDFSTYSAGISLSAWYLYTGPSTDNWSRIIDFGNGAGYDNFVFGKYGATTDLGISIRQGTQEDGHQVAGGWVIGTRVLWF